MKKCFFHLILFSLCFPFLFSSCKCKQKNTTHQSSIEIKNDFEKEGYTKATVISYAIDGCTFLLQLSDEKKLQPTNLSVDFKKDNLAVWIKYLPKKNAVSVCMAGKIVELTDIQLRK